MSMNTAVKKNHVNTYEPISNTAVINGVMKEKSKMVFIVELTRIESPDPHIMSTGKMRNMAV